MKFTFHLSAESVCLSSLRQSRKSLENFRHSRSHGKLVIRKNYFTLISREMRKSWIVISTVEE